VDSVIGALREASFEPERIGVVGPDGRPAPVAGGTPERHGVGPWLAGHLWHRGHVHPEQEPYRGPISQGRWVVTVTVQSDVEDRDARNLLVSAGAEAISSMSDGTLVSVR
jgi:hypothetical protein